MILFVIVYIIRLVTSIICGFLQADKYDTDNKDSRWYKGNKSMIYLKRKNFLIWMIPIFGWIWLLIYQIRISLKDLKFFNE
jgi:heme/copper-type cytochrome/quinol oxidase subunit 2